VLLGVLALLAMSTLPTGHAPLRLKFEHCTDIDQSTVGRVVTIELDAALADERQVGAVTTARAACNGGHVDLTIDDPVTEKSSTRTVALDGQPQSVRSRLLGLAISEAVLASWLELHLAREQRWAPSITLASFEARREAADIAERRLQIASRQPTSPRTDIAAGPSARWFSSGLRTLGAVVAARHWLRSYPNAGVGLDVEGGHGTGGVANLAQASATSGSIAPSLLVRADVAHLAIRASAGWRMGLARLSADPVSTRRWGSASVRGWGGPFLSVEFSVPLSRFVFLSAEVESGYAVVAARGRIDSTPVIGIEGSWLATVLSLGTRL
jgi:hypothetical protein